MITHQWWHTKSNADLLDLMCSMIEDGRKVKVLELNRRTYSSQ